MCRPSPEKFYFFILTSPAYFLKSFAFLSLINIISNMATNICHLINQKSHQYHQFYVPSFLSLRFNWYQPQDEQSVIYLSFNTEIAAHRVEHELSWSLEATAFALSDQIRNPRHYGSVWKILRSGLCRPAHQDTQQPYLQYRHHQRCSW